MAGDFESMKFVVELAVDPSGFTAAIDQIEARLSTLKVAGATAGTPGFSGLYGGGPTGGSVAAAGGSLAAQAEVLARNIPAGSSSADIARLRALIGQSSQSIQSQLQSSIARPGIGDTQQQNFQRTLGQARATQLTQVQERVAADQKQAEEEKAQRAAQIQNDREAARQRTAADNALIKQRQEQARTEARAAREANQANLQSARDQEKADKQLTEQRKQAVTANQGGQIGQKYGGGGGPNGPIEAPIANAQDAVAYATALRGTIDTLAAQRASLYQNILTQQTLNTSGEDIIQASAALAAERKETAAREEAQLQLLLATNQDYISATAQAANLRRNVQAQVENLKGQGAGLENVTSGGLFVPTSSAATDEQIATTKKANLDAIVQQEGQNAAIAKLEEARRVIAENELLGEKENLDLLAQARSSQREQTVALRQATAKLQRAQYEQSVIENPNSAGSLFQQLQANIATRKTGDFRNPNEFLGLGQFLQSRFLTTAGFAVSGVATYAAFAALQKMFTDSKQLETELALIKAQFTSLGDTNFDQFRAGIKGISADTGTAATEVAQLAAQIRGAFGQGAGGNESDAGVLTQTKAATELAKIGGLSVADVGNNAVAIAKTYNISIQDISDKTIALSQRTGVPIKELLDSLGQIAPIADQVGLSFDSTAALIATAAEVSGRSANAIEQSFARVFTTIETNGPKILQFVKQVAPSQAPALLNSLAQGASGQVLQQLASIYPSLSRGQQSGLQSLLGRPRDIQDLIPYLQNYNQVVQNTAASQHSAGTEQAAFAQLQNTLALQVARVGAAFRQMGEALLSLGLSQVLQDIAKALGLIVGFAAGIINFFAAFNNLLGGIPSKAAALAAELLLVLKVMQQLKELQVGQILLNVVGGASGAASGAAEGQAAGGLLGFLKGKFGSQGSIIGSGGLRGGKLGQVFGGGGGAAAGEGALIGGDAALVGGETALGAESLPLLTGPQALVAIPAIIGLAGYLKVRGDVNKAAEAHLAAYRKLDQKTLQTLIGSEHTSTSETIGRTLTGSSTDLDNMKKALREIETTNTLDPALTALAGAVKDHADLLAAIAQAQTNLDKSKGDSKGAFNTATDLVNGLNTLVDSSTSNPALESVQVGLSQNIGKKGGDASGNEYNVLLKQRQALQDIVKAEASKNTSKAKELRDKYFAGSDASANDLSNVVTNAINTINTTNGKDNGLNLSETQLIALNPALKGLKGPELKTAIKNIKDVNEAISIGNQAAKQFASLQTVEASYDQGFTTPANFLQALKADRDSAATNLAALLNNPQANPDDVTKIAQEVSADDQKIAQVYKSRFDAITSAAQLTAQIQGKDQTGQDQATAKAALQALASQPLAIDPQGHQDQQNEAKDYITKQQAYYQELAKGASNQAEADKIISEGFKIPTAIQAILNVGVLQNETGVLGEALVDLAKEADGSFTGFEAALANAMAEGKAALATFIKGQVQKLRKLVDDAVKSGADLSQFVQAYHDLNTILKNLGTIGGSAAPDKASGGAFTLNDAGFNLEAAQAGEDPIKQAQAAIDKANAEVEVAKKNKKPDDLKNAQADLLKANQQLADAMQAQALSVFDVAAALATGNPIAEAQVAIQRANAQIAGAHSDAERNAGKAALIAGQIQLQDGINAEIAARFDVASALADGNPIQEAQIALQKAQFQAQTARSGADRLNAVAAEITAQHQLRDALNAVVEAQGNVVVAMLSAAGDTVGAANAQLSNDQRALSTFLSQHPGQNTSNSVPANNLFQKVIQDQAAARDALLSRQEQDIQFELDINKISTGQAISRLQNLLDSANLTESQREDLVRQIYNLKQQITKDLQFNLPTDLQLPTLYEARRLTADQRAGIGYQDNRQVNININGSNLTQSQLTSAVTDAVNAPARTGVRNKLY